MLPPLVPTARETPDHVNATLASIDASVRMHHCSGPLWWMIRYSPNRQRQESGAAMLADQLRQPAHRIDWSVCRQAALMRDGWTLIGDYDVHGELPTEFLANELRIKNSRSEAWYVQRFKQLEADATGDSDAARRKASIQDYIQAEGRHLFRSQVRGRPMVQRA